MRRICSKRSYLFATAKKLKNWFRERRYSEDVVNKKTKRALETPSLGRHTKTSERSATGNGGTRVPLVVNYNPFLSCLRQVIPKSLCSTSR